MIDKYIRYSRKLGGGVWTLLYVGIIYWCYKKHIRIRNRIIKIYVKTYEQMFYIRTNSSDVVIFWTLCLAGEYDIDWPFDFDAKTIIDGGANIGFFSKIISHQFPDAKIIALEPDKSNYQMLLLNCKNNKQIIPILGGLWDKDTYLKVHSDMEAYSITVEETEDRTDIKGYSVASIMREYQFEEIDIFKLDIEGSEYQLFSRNYEDWIWHTKCYIIEIHEYFHEGCRNLIGGLLSTQNGYESSSHMEDTIFMRKDL